LKLVRITTVPMALHVLLKGQMRYMKTHGFEVTMVSADGRERDTVIKDEECPHIIIPMTRQITPFRDLLALYRLTRLLKKIKPDIIHSHTPKAGLLSMIAGKLAGVKIRIHTVAGLRFMTASGMTRTLLTRMEKMTGRFATHVWPNSFSLYKYIVQNKLVTEKKLEVIGKGSSNGINLSRYSREVLQPEKLEAIKLKIGYDENLRYLLCVGRIVKDKGIDELVRAFDRAYTADPGLRLLLVGDYEDDLDPVSDYARRLLKTHPGIIMPGWSDEVEYYMPFAYALLHPSHREGFPNVVLQAGAMLCPVICSRIEGNIDIVDHGETGLLFTAKDPDDLYDQLRFALAGPAVIREQALRLRKKIELYFDQRVVQEMIYIRYMELVGQPGRGQS
jgi:glycosyltransferase involved in cell wall biosynthesis